MQLYQTHVQYLMYYYYSSIKKLMMNHVENFPHVMLPLTMLQYVRRGLGRQSSRTCRHGSWARA